MILHILIEFLSLLNNANVICLMILELLAFYVSKNVPLFVFYMNFVPVFWYNLYIYVYSYFIEGRKVE